MKANEAPKKIILSAYRDSEELSDYWAVSDNTDNIKIEYVRADAFIEGAADKLKQLMYDQHLFEGRMHQDAIIENFVGYFKDYIKG